MHTTQTILIAPDHIPSRFRTLVVHDSAALLERLCRLLELQPLIEVVGAAQQWPAALHLAEVLQPDLVLMDLDMPLVDGLQTTVLLRRRLRHIRVILMCIDDSPNAQAAARAQGAHGFIWETRIQSDLMAEILRAFQMNLTEDQRNTR